MLWIESVPSATFQTRKTTAGTTPKKTVETA